MSLRVDMMAVDAKLRYGGKNNKHGDGKRSNCTRKDADLMGQHGQRKMDITNLSPNTDKSTSN